LLSLQVSHHLHGTCRHDLVNDERAAVKTLPRPRAAPGPGGRSTLQDSVVLGRYRLLEQIGAGGHGSVWIARDERERRTVAVKRIPLSAEDPGERLRIEREGRAAARLAHPAIVRLYDSGDEPDAHYLVSELVEGSSLAQLYHDGRVDDREVSSIGVALADALAHAHERGVVHRDVKPANVIVPALRPPTAPAPAKLTDFGVARLAGEQALTRTGDVIGTLAYMAPEQADGLEAGPQADLYSLALTLYEGFAGTNPLRGRTVAATARRLGGTVTPLRQARPDLPRALCASIDRALAPVPDARGTLADLRAGLGAGPDGGVPHARPTTRTRRVRPPLPVAPSPRVRRLAAAVAAGLLCGVGLALASGPGSLGPSVCVAAGAAMLVAAAAGIGWMVLALGAIAWLGVIGQPGSALVLAAALVPVPLLLGARPWLWSASALAPALGALGLGGAAPALAGRLGGSWPARAALGALSYWWLAICEMLVGRRLLLGHARGARVRVDWQSSLSGALHHALIPLMGNDRLAMAGLWALAALTLPWLVRGPSSPGRALGAAVWAGALTVASVALAARLGVPRPPLPLAFGALAATLAFAQLRAPRALHAAADVA
jgi:hypothetical protein